MEIYFCAVCMPYQLQYATEMVFSKLCTKKTARFTVFTIKKETVMKDITEEIFPLAWLEIWKKIGIANFFHLYSSLLTLCDHDYHQGYNTDKAVVWNDKHSVKIDSFCKISSFLSFFTFLFLPFLAHFLFNSSFWQCSDQVLPLGICTLFSIRSFLNFTFLSAYSFMHICLYA